MRRGDHDVTNTIRTTDLQQVAGEALRVYRGLYDGTPSDAIERAFEDLGRLYAGEHPDYQPCDTEYHDNPARARRYPRHDAADGRLRAQP
ncbi:MAG: hypothetical protein EXR33_06035 [Betaproteobacteria bacterium]|nr:hypothetical protein [Betaproteobacteria bacterium]